MGLYWLVLGSTGSVYLVLGQKNLVPIGIKWNWVSTMRLCLHIEKSGDLVGCHHSETTTNKER